MGASFGLGGKPHVWAVTRMIRELEKDTATAEWGSRHSWPYNPKALHSISPCRTPLPKPKKLPAYTLNSKS